MEINKLKNLMKKYGEAWEKQNPDLLLKIFEKKRNIPSHTI